jgi:hypothetical protein
MRRSAERSSGMEPSSLCRFCQDCIIAMRGYNFREGQVGERPAGEGNAANGLAGLQGAGLADDAVLAQLGHQQVQAAKLEIEAEDGPDRLGLTFIRSASPNYRTHVSA